jgi:hypothetical protein
VPACEAQVLQRALVDGEKAHRRAVLGRHVRNRRAVFHRQAAQARSVELHELVHHALLAQQLRHGQHQVGRCRAFGQLAREFDAHHLRDEHVVGLSQHHGFGFDTPDAPAENAQRVNHRRVAVRADQRVGEGDHLAVDLLGLHHLAEILQVHLMHDARARGHHAEAVERALRPAQQHVPLAVALELFLDIQEEGVLRAEVVHLHGVVDHKVGGHDGVDTLGVFAALLHRVAHRHEVYDARHAREVLQDHAGGHQRDFARFGLRLPTRQRA